MTDLSDLNLQRLSEMQEHGPIMDVETNGQPVRALIDTGAKYTCVRPERASELRLQETGDTWPVRGIERPIYKATLLVAGASFSDHEVYEYPMPPTQPFDVIIGRDILVAFVFEYDGPNSSFTLRG